MVGLRTGDSMLVIMIKFTKPLLGARHRAGGPLSLLILPTL